MATGTGKTWMAVTECYRLIKFGGAQRILFLVDRANLGKQAKNEFDLWHSPYTQRRFTNEYIVQRLDGISLEPRAKVVISTIQRLYSALTGKPIDDTDDERSTYEASGDTDEPRPVAYNPALPPETFDIIIIDECHRSIYNLWKGVLDYFDAFHVGLTATPSPHTLGFFNQNLVSSYTHEQAVLNKVADEIGANAALETDDLDHGTLKSRGGLPRALALFGKERLPALLEELNTALAA